MTSVLLGQSYYLRFDPKLWEAGQPYAPLGTLYAAACLRERGLRVSLFDAMLAESEAEWTRALDRERPAVAAIFEDSFNYLSKMCLGRMRQAAFAMIDAARARGCPIVVSGSDASDHPDVYLARGATAVVLGEGEETLAEVVDALQPRRHEDTKLGGPRRHEDTKLGGPRRHEDTKLGGPRRHEDTKNGGHERLEAIAGLALLDEAGAVRRTPPRAFARDLDALPRPAWDLVDVDRYRRIWRERHGYFSMNVVTTRGCPYSCNWCARPVYGQRYTSRSPEAVVSEIAWLTRTFAPDHLTFADDILGLKPGWIERFAELAVAAGAVVPFKCLMRADLVDASRAAALRAAGCRTVWIGAESGSQRVLDAMDKGLRVEQIDVAARLLHAAGIEVGFFLQFGYPGETRTDIEATRALVRRARPDDIGVSVSYPLPGTAFYDRVRAELGAKQHWDDSSDLAMLYRGPYSTDFYRALHRAVHVEFRLRRTLDELTRVALRPARWRHRHVRLAASALAQAAILPIARTRLARLERSERAGHQSSVVSSQSSVISHQSSVP